MICYALICFDMIDSAKSNMKNICFEFPCHPWVFKFHPTNRFQAIRRELVGDGIALEEAELDRQDYPPWN